MSDVTQILNAIESGDANAAKQLLPLVYDELRRLAAQKMAQEKPGQTLQATALVHEAYLRLVTSPQHEQGTPPPRWNSRGHFFAAAAEAMRRILVESARSKHAEKRGGGRRRVDFRRAEQVAAAPPDDLLALDEALEQLTLHDANAGQLVKLRYFAGLSMEEAADVLGLSRAEAYRLYTFARAWLRVQAAGDSQDAARK
jgi:RNA polymerase sigma factor (TIGR02999 family)